MKNTTRFPIHHLLAGYGPVSHFLLLDHLTSEFPTKPTFGNGLKDLQEKMAATEIWQSAGGSKGL
jgi:hypothetical protein